MQLFILQAGFHAKIDEVLGKNFGPYIKTLFKAGKGRGGVSCQKRLIILMRLEKLSLKWAAKILPFVNNAAYAAAPAPGAGWKRKARSASAR